MTTKLGRFPIETHYSAVFALIPLGILLLLPPALIARGYHPSHSKAIPIMVALGIILGVAALLSGVFGFLYARRNPGVRGTIHAVFGSVFGVLFFIWCLVQILFPYPTSPGDVVKDFYMAANAGKYSEAEGMLAKDFKDAVIGPLGQMSGGWKSICDKKTKNGSITSMEPVEEEIRGEGATVVVTIHFKDGTEKENDKTGLIRQDGKWRITLGN